MSVEERLTNTSYSSFLRDTKITKLRFVLNTRAFVRLDPNSRFAHNKISSFATCTFSAKAHMDSALFKPCR